MEDGFIPLSFFPFPLLLFRLSDTKEYFDHHQRANIRTPLHQATSACDLRIARLLLEAGADVNAQNTVGSTPLHIAIQDAYEDSLEMVELLLSYGACLKRKTIDKKTPLQFTDSDAVKKFVEKGVKRTFPSLKLLAVRAVWKHRQFEQAKQLPVHLWELVHNFPEM